MGESLRPRGALRCRQNGGGDLAATLPGPYLR